MSKDAGHEAIIVLRRYQQKELLIWFANMWLAALLTVGALVQYINVQSEDVNRDFISVTLDGKYLEPSPATKPSPLSNLEVEQWMLDSIYYCMTFDYQSYGFVSSICNSDIFATTLLPSGLETHGQHFQSQLKEAGIIDIMFENQTSSTINVLSSKLIDAQPQTFTELIKRPSGDYEQDKTRYTYEFDVVFKIEMAGQKLDAPIRYQILVERVSETTRWHGLAVRSVLSLD